MVSLVLPEPVAGVAQSADRLDGWKSIAAYLKRDRTTVIRWARERSLPVHRLPGGKTGTVFALRHELDRWAGVPDHSPALAPPNPSPEGPAPPKSGRWRITLLLASIAFGAVAVLVVHGATPARTVDRARVAPALPGDPLTASRFLLARDLIAERKSAGLERAIAMLEQVISVAPDYALAHASLAEALLLSREFGMRSDADTFQAARLAARSAIRIQPDIAIGYRLLGFIAYWADHDFQEADAQFRRALLFGPDDAFVHFWYGNILSDHGDHRAALKALNQARLIQPGSVAIRTDLAWAQWAAGQDAVAIASLEAIARDYPNFAVVHDCLAVIMLSAGNYAGYVRHFSRYAELRDSGPLIARAHVLNHVLRRSVADTRKEIMRQAMADAALDGGHSYALPALIASVGSDRIQVHAILKLESERGVRSGNAALMLRIQRRWRSDAGISALISQGARL